MRATWFALCSTGGVLIPTKLTRCRWIMTAAPDGYDFGHTDEALIAEAGRRLAAAAPGATVILFGSRARGEGRTDSDLDLLVIEPDLRAAAPSSCDSVKRSAISAFRSTS
jgi:hypothetical protein